ncbi:hypothetical protein Syun_001320 [Stephania yunnanensis]|uniref:Uncharacterized protein n=1 Tax=Stephania yunnanensis TaxID=152371 RepID=A0AAP0Q6C8_9MAGN
MVDRQLWRRPRALGRNNSNYIILPSDVGTTISKPDRPLPFVGDVHALQTKER